MRRNISFLCALSATLAALSAGCGDDDDVDLPRDGGADASVDGSVLDGGMDASSGRQPITLTFKATVGARDLTCGENYTGQGSTKVGVTPQDFRFFVQEVRLVTAGGREERLSFDDRLPFQTKDVALLDFAEATGTCLSGVSPTNRTITGTVPSGDYRGVVFVIGVPESLNHSDFTMAPKPLSDPSTSWQWQQGYRFLMAELTQTATADGGVPTLPDGGIGSANALFHLGSGACSGTPGTGFTCGRANRAEVRLSNFDPTKNRIVADLGAVFADADLGSEIACHGSMPVCAPMFRAVGVEIDAGTPLTTQSVFRVE